MADRKTITLLLGHPDAGPTLCRAMAEAYRSSAEKAGHQVHFIDLAAVDFPILRSSTDYNEGEAPASIVPIQENIRECDHFVMIFPMWVGTMPALLKGLLEQVFRPGFGIEANEGKGFPRALMKGKSAHVIMTMGMPAFAYRMFFGGHGLKNLQRSMLGFCGFKPIKATLFGMIGSRGRAYHDKCVEKVAALGAAGA